MAKNSVLVVEDDEATREMVKAVLDEDGYCVYAAASIAEGLRLARERKPGLAVLDRLLPDGDGIQLCLKLKADPALAGILVLMLTGQGRVEDRVLGLRLGADDYLAKPFSTSELSARAAALIRRKDGVPPRSLAAGSLRMDLAGRTVAVGKRPLALTNMEFDLLRAFMEKPGEVLTRESLLETVWDAHAAPVVAKTVDMTVMSLRRKLGVLGESVVAVRGLGYKFLPPR